MIFPPLNHMHFARPLPMPCEENGNGERTREERGTLAFEGEKGKIVHTPISGSRFWNLTTLSLPIASSRMSRA